MAPSASALSVPAAATGRTAATTLRPVIAALLAGAALGLGAGMAPGPLLGLTITATLRGGAAAGVRTAMAPLVTDTPIVLLAVLVVTSLPRGIEQGLAVTGGAVVVWFGIEAMRSARGAGLPGPSEAAETARTALGRAAAVNVLSPHPWLFWLTIGGTQLLTRGREVGWPGPALFLLGFYALLVGSKVAVALSLHVGRRWLDVTGYRRLLFASGLLLVAAGVVLAGEAVL
jgi:threonine/homoserine/homoserine lactone efflux protein